MQYIKAPLNDTRITQSILYFAFSTAPPGIFNPHRYAACVTLE